MKRSIKAAVAVSLLLLGCGCSIARTPVVNSVDISKTDFSNIGQLKQSEACATFILGFIGPFGDPSVVTAIKTGGIKTVKVVDHKAAWYVLFSQDCVVVYGE